jgi:hypothetical protein
MGTLSRRHVVLYVIWLAAFLLIELPAVFSDASGDTFSEMIWALMDRHTIWAAAVIAFCVWLTKHFAGRIFQGDKQ